jgi:DNA polymerase-1
MAADYSQVEVRLLAIMADDKNLLEAFKEWKDIHHKTAEFLFPNQVITNNERKIAKAVNFWVIYGISAFGLSKMINISMKDAKTYIDAFYNSYPSVKEYFDKTIESCEDNWYVETFFGRKRIITWINDKNAIIKNAAKREAINMPIQWTSADIIKLAMIQIQDFINTENLSSKMILQVHDELVFDVYPWENKILAEKIKEIMESILDTAEITLKVDIVEWESWKDTK